MNAHLIIMKSQYIYFIYSQAIGEVASYNLENIIDIIVTLLLSRLGDKCLEVRRLALIGIGNVGQCSDMVVQKRATSLLSSLLMGMDDRQVIKYLPFVFKLSRF